MRRRREGRGRWAEEATRDLAPGGDGGGAGAPHFHALIWRLVWDSQEKPEPRSDRLERGALRARLTAAEPRTCQQSYSPLQGGGGGGLRPMRDAAPLPAPTHRHEARQEARMAQLSAAVAELSQQQARVLAMLDALAQAKGGSPAQEAPGGEKAPSVGLREVEATVAGACKDERS